METTTEYSPMRELRHIMKVVFMALPKRFPREDIAVDLWLELWQKFRGPLKINDDIIRLRCRDYMGTKIKSGPYAEREREVPLQDIHERPSLEPDDVKERAQKENAEVIGQLVSHLHKEQKRLIYYHFYLGRNKYEIAKRLGWHPSTVVERVKRVISELQRWAAEEDIG